MLSSTLIRTMSGGLWLSAVLLSTSYAFSVLPQTSCTRRTPLLSLPRSVNTQHHHPYHLRDLMKRHKRGSLLLALPTSNNDNYNTTSTSTSTNADDGTEVLSTRTIGYRRIEDWHAEHHDQAEHTMKHVKQEHARWKHAFDTWQNNG